MYTASIYIINIQVYSTHIHNQYTCVSYGCYLHLSWFWIWVLCTCMLIVHMGVIYIYIDGVYGCYIPVYWLYIWVLYTCILIVYMGATWANTENIRIGLVFVVLAQWKCLYCIDRFDNIKANKSRLINNHCRDENINMANLQIKPAVKPSVKLAAKLIHILR
jgi:hypothetical protein